MRYYSATVQVPTADGRRLNSNAGPLFDELERSCWVATRRVDGSPMRRDEDYTVTLGIAIPHPNYEMGADDAVGAAMRQWGVSQFELVSTSPATSADALFGGETLLPHRREMADVAHALDLSQLVALHRFPDLCYEELASEIDLPTAQAIAAGTTYGEPLDNELAYILADSQPRAFRRAGVPVHYLVREETAAPRRDAVRAVTSALYSAGRVPSPHVYHFDLNYVDRTLDSRVFTAERQRVVTAQLNRSLVESLLGGTVVVHYGHHDNEGDYSADQYQAVRALLSALYAEPTIQVVLVVPAGKRNVEKRMRASYPRAFLDFEPTTAPSLRHEPEATVLWLQERAREAGLHPDERLDELVEESLAAGTEPQVLFEQWRQEKLIREAYPQYSHLDVPQGSETEPDASAWDRLDQLVGLDDAKRVIHATVRKHRMRPHYRAAGIELPPMSLHAAFLGAPGTGKTEVARLYAEILRSEGVVSEGRVFEVSGAHLTNFTELFKRAKGSVIFIDEAYGLIGKNVTDLIAQMENNRADTVVILAGYKDEMDALLRTNPGFKSRIGVTVHFPDYTPEQMVEIFRGFVSGAGLLLDDAALPAVRDILTRTGRPEDQGNARHVRDVFEQTMGNLLLRIEREYPDPSTCAPEVFRTVTPKDVPGYGESVALASAPSARAELEMLIGLEEVKTQVKKLVALASAQKERRDAGLPTMPISMHMAFKGNPGTGKTEVARLIARILREEGILSVGDLIECGRQDLVGQFVGQTAPKVHSLFRRARGSVLFIDEAYTLLDMGNGGFGQEAIDTIVKDMEDYRNEVVVIFAGYPKPLERLFAANPGFNSRVKHHITFPDYSTDELIEVLDLMVAANKLDLEPDVYAKVETIIEEARCSENFGNARFVRQLLESALENQALRGGGQVLCAQDFEAEPRGVQRHTLGFQF